MKKNCIEIYKTGKFYNAYGDDGIIIHELLGYKFVRYKNSVGFPESAISKVKGILKKENISYQIFEKNTLIEKEKGLDKNYNKILKIALKNIEIQERLERIKEKIDGCSTSELEKILEGIENGTLG